MEKPVSISLKKFTASVQSAVTAATAKHPKFRAVHEPTAVSFTYLIRGFPLPDGVLSQVTLSEAQAFATDVAAQIGQAAPEALGAARQAPHGVVLSFGGHVTCGIPAVSDEFQLEA